MDWRRIKNIYPKSFRQLIYFKKEKLKVHMSSVLVLTTGDVRSKFNNRDLYDFFDRYNIFTQVILIEGLWYIRIVADESIYSNTEARSDTDPVPQKNRRDAERDAFMLSFDFMEKNKL